MHERGFDVSGLAAGGVNMDERLKQLAEETPEIRRMLERAALDELVRTIRLARVRCIAPEKLIARVPGIWEDANRSEVILRLSELELSEQQLIKLADAVRVLAHVGDRLPSREKSRVDSALGRIIRILPRSVANELVEPFLDHPRRSRREIAYRSLRQVGVTVEMARKLIQAFERTGDENLLELIARSSETVPKVNALFLLEKLSEDYWRVRVIQALLRHAPTRAIELASSFPREFVWALGREKARAQLNIAIQLSREHPRDIEFLSLFAWALGQLGADKELEDLVGHVANVFLVEAVD
jgi:hypothetical protein